MFRINYSKLDKKQVESILAKGAAPVGLTEFCTRLVGKKLKIVLDKLPVEGPVLEYEFPSATMLTLKENDGAAVPCGYGAYSLKDITLFSHMVNGTKRGYTIIINWKTSVVTAYEMWFIDYEGEVIDTAKVIYKVQDVGKLKPFVNREVQRQSYFGYIEEPGKTPPPLRDKLTLRLENASIKWEEDRGKKWLTTYTSALYTTYVELDTPDGGDTLTFASDILQISDSQYIHCYGEVEYSGRLSVEVIDLYGVKKIGVTMGIDENDEFEHVLYKGNGQFLGRYSTFYDFNFKGDEYSDFAKTRYDFTVKGARYTYRPSIMAKKMTAEEITESSKHCLIFDPEEAKTNTMAANAPADSDFCAGKDLTFRGDDDYTVELRFKTATELEYRLAGEVGWRPEPYRAMELDEDLIIAGFYCSGSNPPASYIFVLDFDNGCATCIYNKVGSQYNIRDVEQRFHFGVMETEGLKPMRIFRHGFTDELVGRAFTQNYSGAMSSIHIYNAPRSYSWTIITDSGIGSPSNRTNGPVWSSPCEYVKFRDDVYLMSFVEQRWDGLLDAIFRNLRTGRDCGFGFGLSLDGQTVSLHKIGSYSRAAGRIDLSGVYPLRNHSTRS